MLSPSCHSLVSPLGAMQPIGSRKCFDWLTSQPIGTPQQLCWLCARCSTQRASVSGAVRWDADAEEPPWSVASSDLNVSRHVVLSEAAALCWPLSLDSVVCSGAAAGGSSRRRGDGQLELEAVHLRRDGLDCRRIRYVMQHNMQPPTVMYAAGLCAVVSWQYIFFCKCHLNPMNLQSEEDCAQCCEAADWCSWIHVEALWCSVCTVLQL